MLIIAMISMIVSTIIIAYSRRDKLSIYLMAAMASFVIMFTGIIIYIAKVGGYNKIQRTLLFIIPNLQIWLQYRPIPLGQIGYAVAIGRTLFPYFLIKIALEYSMTYWIRKYNRAISVFGLILPIIFLIYYYPPIFKSFAGGKFNRIIIMKRIGLIWIGIYLFVSIALLLIEYFNIRVHFYKQRFKDIVLLLTSITALYCMYAIQDPGQIYNMYISEYLRMGSLIYIRGSNYGWVIVTLVTIFFVVLGTSSLIQYTQLDFREDKEDIIVERKFDATVLGATVFVHSIKNHLLSSRVLHKRIDQELSKNDPSIEYLKDEFERLKNINEGIMVRMDDLYDAVKSNTISLKPYPLKDIIEISIKRFNQKYPEQVIDVDLDTINETLLADANHLSEAIYNVLINAYEAILVADRSNPKVEILVHEARIYTVIEIRDNGVGIPTKKLMKVYDPFFTTKNTNSNWGMGLYYVRKIVKGHIGRIKIESSKCEGTSFYIMLPKIKEANEKEVMVDG